MDSKYIAIFMVAVVVFFAIDLIWLGLVAKDFYQKQLSALLAKDTNWTVAVIFYMVYIVGILVFAVRPAIDAGDPMLALKLGAMFGFFAYATYDLTNLATLEGWPIKVVIVDMMWGTILSGSVAYTTYVLADKLSLL